MPPSPHPDARPGAGAWLVVALLVPVALLNYLDRQMLASMKFSVMADLPGIAREARWGTVLAVFKWVYALASPFGGFLADRYSRRHVIAGSLWVWSLVTWMTGHVTTYEQLVAARALMGVSEALYLPAALALVADVHAGATRSRAVGVHQMGIYLGALLGGFGGYAAESPAIGWRAAFAACGAAGAAYAVPLFVLLRLAPRDATRGPVAALGGALGELARTPSFLLLVAYFTLPAIAAWVVRDWMPAILKAEFGIGQGAAGVSATLYWQSAAIVGAVLGGWLADRWTRRTPRGRIHVSALGMTLIVPAMFGVGYAPASGALWVAVAFLVLFGLGWGCFDANNMPILAQIVRPPLRATGYGVMNLVSIGAGGFADWGFGALRDRRVPLFGIFSAFASAALLSVALVLLIRPRDTESV